jgi:hypothetical protein
MYNKLYLKTVYSRYIHDDGFNNFLFINTQTFKTDEYFKYFIVNEIFQGKFNLNVNYFYSKMYIIKDFEPTGQYRQIQTQLYNKIQRFNLGFSRLVNLIFVKYKKSKNDNNLLFEEINKSHMTIIDRGVKYYFEYFELFKIVNSAFKYNEDGEYIIKQIRNPYTNKIFKMYIVVNIYFALLNNGNIPLYFFLFFKHNFSKSYLYENYNYNLFIDTLKSVFNDFSYERYIYLINQMINESCYRAFIRANDVDKIELLKSAALDYFISKKLKNHFSSDIYWLSDVYIDNYTNKMKYIKKRYPRFGVKRFMVRTNILKNY